MEELNLTPEEIEQLKADGLIPPDWQPGDPLFDDPNIQEPAPGDLEDDEEIEGPAGDILIGGQELPLELGLAGDEDAQFEEGVNRGALEDPEAPGPKTMGAVDLLNRYEAASPSVKDPSIQLFSDIALRWLPTDDKVLEESHARAKSAADQLAQIRMAAEKAAEAYPWEAFASAILTPGVSYATALGKAMGAVGQERTRRRGELTKAQMAEAELGARQAQQAEVNQMTRIRTGAELARLMGGHATASKTGAWGKKMADLGIDINTPEGQLASRRMWVMEQAKNNPAAVQVLLENPELDPRSPEFAQKVAEAHMAKADEKEGAAEAKERRAEAREKRQAAESAARLEAARTTVARNRLAIEQAKKGGISGGKVPAEIQRQQLALRSLDSGIEAYKTALDNIDPRSFDQLDSGKQATIKSMLADLIISWKEAAALGALTGPDVAMIERTLTDPFSVKGAWYGKKGLSNQLEVARGALGRRAKALEDQYGANLNVGGGGGGPKEVERRTKDGRMAIFDADTKKFLRYK